MISRSYEEEIRKAYHLLYPFKNYNEIHRKDINTVLSEVVSELNILCTKNMTPLIAMFVIALDLQDDLGMTDRDNATTLCPRLIKHFKFGRASSSPKSPRKIQLPGDNLPSSPRPRLSKIQLPGDNLTTLPAPSSLRLPSLPSISSRELPNIPSPDWRRDNLTRTGSPSPMSTLPALPPVPSSPRLPGYLGTNMSPPGSPMTTLPVLPPVPKSPRSSGK